jgi:hypothetical protein
MIRFARPKPALCRVPSMRGFLAGALFLLFFTAQQAGILRRPYSFGTAAGIGGGGGSRRRPWP